MIIGFAGRAGAGKTTAAMRLVDKYGYEIYSFAKPIKDLLCPFFGWDGRHAYGELKEEIDTQWGFSPRAAFQTFGTEFARALNPDFWLIKAQQSIKNFNTAIDDIRFTNEAGWTRKRGILIHVIRPDAKDVRQHVSETPLEIHRNDLILQNNGTIEDLYQKLDGFLGCLS